jgi:plastocyanin
MKYTNTQRGVAPLAIILSILVIGGLITLVVTRTKNTPKESTPVPETTESFPLSGEAPIPPSATPSAATAKTVTIKLTEQNGSRQSGEAVLTETDGKTKVVVTLSGKSSDVPMPSHIHSGTCEKPGDVIYPLSNVEKGAAQTTLSVPLSEVLKNLPIYVNVHKSATELQTSVSCGSVLKPAPVAKPLPVAPTASEDRFIVHYTASGFNPKTIEIKRGEAIKFVNDTNQSIWVATNDHPTHTLYPGFDQGKSAGKGGTFIFTFTEAGSWKYHNHNKPSDQGTIVVK